MGLPGSDKPFIYRFSSSQWHTILPMTNSVTYLETISGPYNKKETQFAKWAPSSDNSKESIKTFITDHDILITKLNDYLLTTQKEKFYMLYKNSKISMQTINLDDYIITEIKKEPRYSRYIAYTKTKNKLKILLRWKNGNGIAFPSFQIS